MPGNWSFALASVLSLASLPVSCGDANANSVDPTLVHTVESSDMFIRVREQAELEAAKNKIVASEVEGSSRLIYLIRQGTRVSPGDKIAELDVSSAKEKRALQAISVAKADAAREQAAKNFAIMEKDLRAAEMTAETRLLLAEMLEEKLLGHPRPPTVASQDTEPSALGTNQEMVDKLRDLVEGEGAGANSRHTGLVDKVLDLLGPTENLKLEMGELANLVLQMIDEVSLARVDLEMAKDTLGHSRRLAAKGHITANELERDEISYKRQFSKVTLSWNNLQLLIQYTLPETKITRQQEVLNAKLGYQSVVATSEARRVREGAELRSTQAEYDLAKERLESLDRQIEKSVVLAPSPGLVVYARHYRSRVRVGSDIDDQQPIVYLPDVSTMVAQVMVHEAQIDKVRLGQLATMTLDGFPGETFTGRVTLVSSLPDSRSRWGNRDLKVYEVHVQLDRDNRDGELRPGMTATVVIDVGVIRDVLNIPLLALERSGNNSYVFKVTPEGPVPTIVSLGANNLTRVQVLDGLKRGEQIYLVPPVGANLPAPTELETDLGSDRESGSSTGSDGSSSGDESSTRPADGSGK